MKTIRYLALVGVLSAGCLLTGCTTNINYVKAHSLAKPALSTKIPIAVELRLDEQYRNARWAMKYMGSTTAIPLGAHLVTNTIEYAQGTFEKVTVTTPGTNTPAIPVAFGAAAIVIPRLVYVDVSGDMRKDPITMALEWTVLDSSRRLVWVDSFRSEIRGPVEDVKGTKRKVQRRFDIVLEDLFKQSREAMQASPEIRRFSRASAGEPKKEE